jgi:hypothetical protein
LALVLFDWLASLLQSSNLVFLLQPMVNSPTWSLTASYLVYNTFNLIWLIIFQFGFVILLTLLSLQFGIYYILIWLHNFLYNLIIVFILLIYFNFKVKCSFLFSFFLLSIYSPIQLIQFNRIICLNRLLFNLVGIVTSYLVWFSKLTILSTVSLLRSRGSPNSPNYQIVL